MELRSLRYFVKIVELGSLSRAAEALFVAQPSLSHQVAILEADLGVKLLDRSPRGVKATVAGLTLFRCAQTIIRQIEEVRREVKGESGSVAGDVSIGLPTSTAVVLALPLLKAVVRQFPNVCLEINENGSGLLGEWLLHGRIDMAILFTAGPMKSLRCQHLLTEEICLVRSLREDEPSPSAQGDGEISVAQLQDEPLVLPSKSNGLRRVVDEVFAKVGVQPRIVAELSMLRTLKEAVLGGVASTMLPTSAIVDELQSGRVTIKRIVEPSILRPLSLCTNASVPLSAAGEAVHATVVATINQMLDEGIWPGVVRPSVHRSETSALGS